MTVLLPCASRCQALLCTLGARRPCCSFTPTSLWTSSYIAWRDKTSEGQRSRSAGPLHTGESYTLVSPTHWWVLHAGESYTLVSPTRWWTIHTIELHTKGTTHWWALHTSKQYTQKNFKHIVCTRMTRPRFPTLHFPHYWHRYSILCFSTTVSPLNVFPTTGTVSQCGRTSNRY